MSKTALEEILDEHAALIDYMAGAQYACTCDVDSGHECAECDMNRMFLRLASELAEHRAEQNRPKCDCGASSDPASCGHSPTCPMKAIEG